ncbi:MAG: cation-transporting P-type ATPase [Euryarchaeota archaeon]|nr:cation-transporting P-type ATPase [Euryarchaeota archaeon]
MRINTLSSDRVYAVLGTSADGIDSHEADARIRQFGYNEIRKVRKIPLIYRFLSQFTHFFAVMLSGAARLAFLGEYLEPGQGMFHLGCFIIAVIVVNAIFTFVQEYRAERAAEALAKLLPSFVSVIRSGSVVKVNSRDIVPGDVVVLSPGDKIPADARIIEQYELKVNNAPLTGESRAVRRTADPAFEDEFVENPNLVFGGTMVAAGSGKAVVFATGASTEFGKIAHLTQTILPEPTPLQREIHRVTRIIALIAVIMGICFFILGGMVDTPFWVRFSFAIGIIVANVPEGLLPTVTLSLAMGSQRMAKRNALIKNLNSVETLGCTTVICTDKTGTLTQNKMVARKIYANQKVFEVSGTGYEPKGDFYLDERMLTKEETAQLNPILSASVLCNDATLRRDGDRWDITGDPTEGALLVAAQKAFDIESKRSENPRVSAIPFDSDRKRMTVVTESDEKRTAWVKGALDSLLPRCDRILMDGEVIELTDDLRTEILKKSESFAREAQRVLAFAHRDAGSGEYSAENTEKDLIFLGLIGMIDPPRPEVFDAVKKCKDAGVRVVMITGDDSITASAIGENIGIVSDDPVVITGLQLRTMSHSDLVEKLEAREIIFARMTPEHKMRVVTALQERGEIVAVTGDGVNDAPALAKADIGIAMGISGTDVAKESSDMILIDDNFASIVSAIEEGRGVFDNIKKFITYIFASNIPEIIPYIIFVIFPESVGFLVPLTIMQILAIDLGTDMLPALALGTEKPEPDVMRKPPRSPGERLLDRALLARAYLFLGPIEALAAMSGYFWMLSKGGWVSGALHASDMVYRRAITMAQTAIVITQVANGMVCRTAREAVHGIGFFTNRLLLLGIAVEILLQIFIVYHPLGNAILNTAPIDISDWRILLPFAVLLFVAEEARKAVVRVVRK